jgi:hypothetical protein
MLDTVLALMILVSSHRPDVIGASPVVLASHSFSLENRYSNKFVNVVFKDNILLALKYMDGEVKSKADISWPEIEKPFHFEFTLAPGERFAFDDNTLPQYSANIVKTTNARFIGSEGFKYDGDLIGDGVCHLASLIYWAARDAGLSAYAPSNHNFAKINDVPKEYGVGIMSTTPLGNLYVTNNLENPVTFVFAFDGTNLTVSIAQSILS